MKIFVHIFILSILLQRDWGGIANTDNCPWEPRLHLFDSSREVALPTFRDIQTLHSKGGDHWRLKNTEVQSQSQQMAFTRSPSLSNNHKTLNNYFIFAVVLNTLWWLDTKDIFCKLDILAVSSSYVMYHLLTVTAAQQTTPYIFQLLQFRHLPWCWFSTL